jgi:hypothetical protein
MCDLAEITAARYSIRRDELPLGGDGCGDENENGECEVFAHGECNAEFWGDVQWGMDIRFFLWDGKNSIILVGAFMGTIGGKDLGFEIYDL